MTQRKRGITTLNVQKFYEILGSLYGARNNVKVTYKVTKKGECPK